MTNHHSFMYSCAFTGSMKSEINQPRRKASIYARSLLPVKGPNDPARPSPLCFIGSLLSFMAPYLPRRYPAADGTLMGSLKGSNKHSLCAAEVVLLVDESRMTCEAATSIAYLQCSATHNKAECLKFAEGCLIGSLTAESLWQRSLGIVA
jgi:hypothetical protein